MNPVTFGQNWAKFPSLGLRYGVHKVFETHRLTLTDSRTDTSENNIPPAPKVFDGGCIKYVNNVSMPCGCQHIGSLPSLRLISNTRTMTSSITRHLATITSHYWLHPWNVSTVRRRVDDDVSGLEADWSAS